MSRAKRASGVSILNDVWSVFHLAAVGGSLCSATMSQASSGTGSQIANSSSLATFGAGCFWCVEAVFERLPGVKSVTSGYAGGITPNPDYKSICSGTSGHAEVVQIEFNPAMTSFEKLLEVFWLAHNPTTLNQQGADRGTQYRSVIMYHDEDQKIAAAASKQAAQAQFEAPIVTEIVALGKFYPAEDYHQDFYRNNPSQPYCLATIPPKLKKLNLL